MPCWVVRAAAPVALTARIIALPATYMASRVIGTITVAHMASRIIRTAATYVFIRLVPNWVICSMFCHCWRCCQRYTQS
jgi:hypothetical protein